MDYLINIDSIQNKQNELNNLKTTINTLTNEVTTGYLNSVSGSEISSLITKIKNSSERLKKGYENSSNWLNRYINEINSVENKLSNTNNGSVKTFNKEFIDIFGKQVIPILKTESKDATTIVTSDLEAKKKAFMGDVNDASQFYIDLNYRNKLAHMTCFDNTTGEILKDNDILTLKPGETRILTVKLPDYCGEIDYVYRTTAQEDKSGVITNKSDIDPDPNNIEWIRWDPNNPKRRYHLPQGLNLKFNTYEWVITANRDGTFLASQTCEFRSHGTASNGKAIKYSGKKAMVAIKVIVKE